MSDSPLEELEHHEHAEHAAHAAESHDSLISQVTFTIAVLAVLAAVCASLETTEGDAAIAAKNDAVLAQNQASDTWNQYQADSLKKYLFSIAAAENGPKAGDYKKQSAEKAAEEKTLQPKAAAFETTRDKFRENAEVHERRHGRLTISSTLLHMAIAIATLAIILHRRWPWLTALALTAGGLIIGAWAYL
ncbi:MAG: DUF4337 family protein [Caulobacterales bacterium]